MSLVTNKEAILNLATIKQKEIIRHEFSKDEMADMKDQVSTNFIRLSDLEDELQEIKDDFKSRMDPLKKDNKHLLMNIRLGFTDKEMEVLLIPDYDNRIMELYDEQGTKLGERKMLMSEYQGRLPLR